MKRTALFYTLVVVLLSSAGCSTSTLYVTYLSHPPGAALYENDRVFGYCPLILEYNITQEDRQRGYMVLRGLTARWVSGASATVPSVQANLNNGTSQQFTFLRPEGAEGLQTDLQFALDLERNRILQQQADAQRSQAFWQMYNAVINQNQ